MAERTPASRTAAARGAAPRRSASRASGSQPPAVRAGPTEAPAKASRGIQSIEVGGRLLVALARSARPMFLRDLAREAGMTSAKAHPYLASFVRIGMVDQDAATGRYELGPLALQLGLASLQRLDPVRIATPAVVDLVAGIEHTAALAVWGNRGPTIVRIEESAHPIHVNMRAGTVMSLLDSATGQAFAAWLPERLTGALIRAELGRRPEGGTGPSDAASVAALLEEVRRHGLARAAGRPIPGVNAFSAPVFDHSGAIVLAITAMGPSGTFDAGWDSPIAERLRECAAGVSRQLGYRG